VGKSVDGSSVAAYTMKLLVENLSDALGNSHSLYVGLELRTNAAENAIRPVALVQELDPLRKPDHVISSCSTQPCLHLSFKNVLNSTTGRHFRREFSLSQCGNSAKAWVRVAMSYVPMPSAGWKCSKRIHIAVEFWVTCQCGAASRNTA